MQSTALDVTERAWHFRLLAELVYLFLAQSSAVPALAASRWKHMRMPEQQQTSIHITFICSSKFSGAGV